MLNYYYNQKILMFLQKIMLEKLLFNYVKIQMVNVLIFLRHIYLLLNNKERVEDRFLMVLNQVVESVQRRRKNYAPQLHF